MGNRVAPAGDLRLMLQSTFFVVFALTGMFIFEYISEQ